MTQVDEGFMTVFETERLRLREMTMEDANLLLQIFSDPVAMQHYPSTKDIEQTKGWIEWTRRNYKGFGVGLWIVERRGDGEFLGQCGIVPQEVEGKVEFEIGYLFVRRHWGQGYATEAAAACRDYGFHKQGYNKLISLIAPQNLPSRRVAERIGMHLERHVIWKNKPIDVYSIEHPGEMAIAHSVNEL
jgi:RimJ/RimL family protein N-acetyltransferase